MSMAKVPTSIGLPTSATNPIASLYDESYCRIQHNGNIGQAFDMKAGVRQGCPLSPLIYAVVAEVLLDNLEHHCTQLVVRSYADDTAIVVEDVWTEGPMISQLFAQLHAISGLALNVHKCVLIPLYPGDYTSTKRRIADTIPRWQQMQVSDKGKYLGFYIGPGKGDSSWQDPTKKYSGRCHTWQDKPLGLQYHTTVYNTLCVSTLTYIAQLEHPPHFTLEAETQGLPLGIRPRRVGDQGRPLPTERRLRPATILQILALAYRSLPC